EEVLEAHLRQIARHDRALNAVVTLDETGARHRAREADEALARGEVWGPLHGVPVTIKDCFETAGLKTTAGFPPLEDHVPAEDATVVARMRNAGAIVLGKTNLSLLATDWQTDNPVFGRTNNPWDRSRTPGGSSGGGGAAVAAGLSPLDIGSDIGGSIRVPAHFCGVYGFKPTEHRVPSTGHIPDWHVPGKTPPGSVRHMGVYGPLARSVADLELSFSILAGPDGSQPEVPPFPMEQVSAPPSVKELDIAWSDRLGGVTPSSETRAMVEKIASTLERNGARVERLEPMIDFDSLWRTWGEVAGAEIGGPLPFLLRNMIWLQFLFMRDRTPIRAGILGGIRMDWRKLADALARRDEIIRRMEALIEPYDAWICPVTAGAAFAHRKPGKPVEVEDRKIPYFLAVGGYTTPFNVSGHPVVILPVGLTEKGLPLGVQVVGHRWKDERLLAVASSLDDLVGDLRHPPDHGAQEVADGRLS
ncbi:MAG: amidase, partial [Gemmatimonadota bacterium]|nr:amidase [Gemmatimonadota bacterium]